MYNLVSVEGSGYMRRSIGGLCDAQLLSSEAKTIEHSAAEEQHERQSRIGKRRVGHAVMA